MSKLSKQHFLFSIPICRNTFVGAVISVSVVLLAPLVLSSAFAGDWILTDLGTLGGSRSFAEAINDSGEVVGYSKLAGDVSTHSFLYTDGHMTDLYPLNSQDMVTDGPTGINDLGQISSGVISNGIYYPAIYDSLTRQIIILGSLGGVFYGFNGVATAINNNGAAVGYSYVDDLESHAFIFRNRTMTDLGSFGGSSGGLAINDSGVVVGFASYSISGAPVAAMWANGSIIPICGKVTSVAYDINNLGQVVGYLFTRTSDRAFLFTQQAIKDLGTLPTGLNSVAYAINGSGQIVGNSDLISNIELVTNFFTGEIHYQTNYQNHAFLYQAGAMIDLNHLISTSSTWELNFANDINERGEIVGYGTFAGDYRGYVLTPIRVAVQRLISMATEAGVSHPKPLTATLEAALESIIRGNSVAAANQLQSFQNKVTAQVAPANPVLATALVQAAQQVIDALLGGGATDLSANPDSLKHQPSGKLGFRSSHFSGKFNIP